MTLQGNRAHTAKNFRRKFLALELLTLELSVLRRTA
jgi:hypothetical protein